METTTLDSSLTSLESNKTNEKPKTEAEKDAADIIKAIDGDEFVQTSA